MRDLRVALLRATATRGAAPARVLPAAQAQTHLAGGTPPLRRARVRRLHPTVPRPV